MIKIIKPYGYIHKDLIKTFWEWKGNYYLEDMCCNTFRIDKETFEELKNND